MTDEKSVQIARENPRISVIIPCLNEAAAIGDVVDKFRRQRGVNEVLVIDNGSTDDTAAIATEAGARVVPETRPGKGFALITGLREARSADYYVMVDGDDTYPATDLPALISKAKGGADMVIGTRLEDAKSEAIRTGHGFGNRLFIALVRFLFQLKTKDLFSGYRVLSRRFVESVPLIAHGFEIELELSLQALSHSFHVSEVPVEYRARRTGDASKLRTYRDGVRILRSLVLFVRDYRPMAFFGSLSLFSLILSLAGGWVVIGEFLATGLVPRLPLAVLSAALFLLSAVSLACGMILASVNRRSTELAALLAALRRRIRDP